MNWEVFSKVFVAIFIAEFADKTQIATMSFSTSQSERWVVFAAASAALVASSAIGVLLGAAAGQFVQGVWAKRVTGLVFIVIGVFYLTGRA